MAADYQRRAQGASTGGVNGVNSQPTPATGGKPKLLDRVREKIRLKHYAYRTERVYVQWIRRFILFHNKRHPLEMGATEIEQFLTHLAVEGRVAARGSEKSEKGSEKSEKVTATGLVWV